MILQLASGLYGGVVEARRRLYTAGVAPFTARRAPIPVICIGNLSAGGTGKTPMVEYLARLMPSWGLWPAIVSRGYMRDTPEEQFVLVSDGNEILANPAEGGDEPCLLAHMLKGIAVAVCADRLKACEILAENGLCDSVILDDGFQHLRLYRDCDIVLVDATVDLAKTRLMPVGTRREPLSALRQATCVVHTKVGHPEAVAQKKDYYRSNRARVSKIAPWVPQFAARFLPEGLTRLGGQSRKGDIDFSDLPGMKIAAFAGIANPENFFGTLRALGADVAGKPFADHKSYDYRDLAQIMDFAVAENAEAIVTTAKDAVKLLDMKLPTSPAIYLLTQSVQMDQAESFQELIVDALRRE
jgi:tetraacyldisaccharide 4'-kinase